MPDPIKTQQLEALRKEHNAAVANGQAIRARRIARIMTALEARDA